MTPAETETFIALWNQGASYRDIAQALGCAMGTVASRVAALVAQGKIQPRRRTKVQMLSDGAPAPRGPSSNGPSGCRSR